MAIGAVRVLGDVIVAPQQAWDQVSQRGRWVWPLALLAVATVVAWSAYYSRVDIVWLQDYLLAGSGDLQGRELKLARDLMGPGLLALVTIISSLVVSAVFMLITAGYLSLVARMQRVERSGPSWIVFAAWLAVPEAVALLLTAVRLALGSNPQVLPEAANPVALSQLLGLAGDSPWLSLAGAVGLQTLWMIALCIIGVSRWMKISAVRAALIVTVPVLMFYGTWALIILAGQAA
ncbi:YIP1 family protein [Luteimonas sp. gir]|uniref:YIP1 family protein n=1 Tax=Luteimonas sp. gir TaxID=3127960 RepID=UPI003075C3D0